MSLKVRMQFSDLQVAKMTSFFAVFYTSLKETVTGKGLQPEAGKEGCVLSPSAISSFMIFVLNILSIYKTMS